MCKKIYKLNIFYKTRVPTCIAFERCMYACQRFITRLARRMRSNLSSRSSLRIRSTERLDTVSVRQV